MKHSNSLFTYNINNFDFQNQNNIFLTLDVHCKFYFSLLQTANFFDAKMFLMYCRLIRSLIEQMKCDNELKIIAIPECDVIQGQIFIK